MWKYLLSVCLLVGMTSTWVQAQKKKRYAPDSNYIQSYPQYLTVGMFTIAPSVSMRLETSDAKAKDENVISDYRANISNILGFTLGYRGINVALGFNVPSDNQRNKDLVPSAYNTFSVRLKNPVYYLFFRYSKLQGLTDLNEQNNLDSLSRYVNRDDIRIREYAFEGIYNFSWKKYSYTAPLTFLQRQLKSRVGILAKTGISYNELSADSGLVTSRQSPFFDQLNDVSRISGLSIKLAPGFGGNLVFFHRIYLSAALFIAYDLYLYDYTKFSDGSRKSDVSFIVVLDGRASLGYQSKRFYAGLRYEVDRRGVKFSKAQLTNEYSYVGFEMGYRFKAPGFMNRTYDKIVPRR